MPTEVEITAAQIDQVIFCLQVIGAGVWWVAGALGWRLFKYAVNSKHLL